MKPFSLSVSYEDVMNLVHMQTAYEAKNAPADVSKDGSVINDDKFRDISSCESEEEILGQYWDTAVSELAVIMRRFDGVISCSREAIEATFAMPDNWDEHLSGNIRTSVIDAVVSIICAKWFELTLPAKYEVYVNQATAYESQIVNGLCARLRPTRANILDNSQHIELA